MSETKIKKKDTPMMVQYKDIKKRYPDAFLFFRCGDFYEMFGNDAIHASSILDITLTKRGDIPMSGVPYHSVDVYISKMIKAGKKVAICEQMEDPRTVKGIVKRDVAQVITPGTLIEEKLLSNKSNNFLLAINKKGMFIEISYLDLSTGDFEISEIEYTDDLSHFRGELVRIMPREIVISEDLWINHKNIRELFQEYERILVNRYPAWYFDTNENNGALFKHFKISSWDDLGIVSYETDLSTPGAILRYVNDNAKSLIDHIRTIGFHNTNKIMVLDETTVKNLEILTNLRDGTTVNTLLEVLDDTITSMGGRLLKKWIIEPLVDYSGIIKRQEAVDYFNHNQDMLNLVDQLLKKVMDLERLAARIVMNKANPKDLISIKQSLLSCNEIYYTIKDIEPIKDFLADFSGLEELSACIEEVIKEEPATSINEGNIVREGYNEELDELKMISLKSKEYIAGIEKREREKLKAPSLKIKYNKVLGYFFEVSKLQSKNLDDTYILRQSLVNTHRYTSKELSEYESKVLTARDRINTIEEGIFHTVKDRIFEKIPEIQQNAKIIAHIDVFSSFAKTAIKNHYIRPSINCGNKILIEEGRHPVIEQKLDIDEFIPNDLDLDTARDYLMIITGPNMSGKSTYLRQNALIVLMAQIGSFVPAAQAEIGIVDRIFTRIGTSDNLARGQSTFLVEMIETANILKNATDKSLIIMDEIGRGTSTFDGLSIAWAVLEYIHNKKMMGAKTLFATHYHELTKLENKNGIKNLSIAIAEEDDRITFLHKIIDKPAGRSYGINVANLAHLPHEVIMYAEGILKKLEAGKETGKKIADVVNTTQMELFDFGKIETERKESALLHELKFLDLDRMTPLQALNTLADFQKKIKKSGY